MAASPIEPGLEGDAEPPEPVSNAGAVPSRSVPRGTIRVTGTCVPPLEVANSRPTSNPEKCSGVLVLRAVRRAAGWPDARHHDCGSVNDSVA